jgi:NAD(P)-dependent dehydrogenase (short-subunit alcohol dehydrogenase family)
VETVHGKRVLITGAARGIGYCVAEEFARARCQLVLTDVDVDALARAAEQLRHNLGANVLTFKVDVSQRDQVERMAADVLEQLGGLDILINNAGIGHNAALAATSLETWRKLVEVNFWGPLHHVYAFLPALRASRGHIVNVSSGQAFYRLPSWGAYASVKVAIAVFSEILHYELAPLGIRVTTVYPYIVNTGFYNKVAPTTLAGRLSMWLLPFYSDSPQKVARRIFSAVRASKRVEMISPLNLIGFYTHFVPPLASLVGHVAAWLLTSPRLEQLGEGQAPPPIIDLKRLREGRVGFRMNEVMSGVQEFEPGCGPPGQHAMEFRLSWGPDNLLDWIQPSSDKFLWQEAVGEISVDGLCLKAPCRGSLSLRYFDEHRLIYTLDFDAAGKGYRYVGEKVNIQPWNLLTSHTTCFGRIIERDTGKLISTGVSRFNLNTVPDFVASFRLT